MPATRPTVFCPVCRDLPLRPWPDHRNGRVCARCGSPLRRRPRFGAAGLMLALSGAALLAAATPDLVDTLASQVSRSSTLPAMLERFQPPPDPRLAPLRLMDRGLLAQLSEADRAWIPTREPLPGGGTRYLYRRRPGDPELSVAQIEALIRQPPRHEREQRQIGSLLTALQRAGVQIALQPPLKSGAAAEWDHGARMIRIDPSVPGKGSVDFLRVLTHESIHVAQSCSAGSLRARPRLLGLPADLPLELETQIAEPLYASAPGWEQRLEREAYANQHRGELGVELLRRHCRRQLPAGSLLGALWTAPGAPPPAAGEPQP